MFKSEYLNKVYGDLEKRNSHEAEFLQAAKEVFKSLDLVVDDNPNYQEKAIIERIVEPERIIQFRVPWVDDKGNVQVNRGYRIEFNSAIGPYKGGLRFRENVNLSILKFLGFEQTFKNALTGLPMGGGKGGSDFDPHGKSDNEIMHFCQSFMNELYKYIGPHQDVPAGDLGVGAREVGFLFGQYKRLTNQFDGAITGKGLSFGGLLGRKEATGFGLCYFVDNYLKEFKGHSFEGQRVIISGIGNVALYACKKAIELGGTVVSMSNSKGFIIDEKGIDFETIREIGENHRPIQEYLKYSTSAKYIEDPKKMFGYTKVDICLPCATQNEIDVKEAIKLKEAGCYGVFEGANMPCSNEAVEYLLENGFLYSPGKASNAGGVALSGVEMSQNAMHDKFSFEDVDNKLQKIMKGIYEDCKNAAIKAGVPGNMQAGANIAGFYKVADAMINQGIV